MLPECPTEIVEAQKLGIAIYAGEAEDEMDNSACGMGRRVEAALQPDQGLARPRQCDAADPARKGDPQDGGGLCQF